MRALVMSSDIDNAKLKVLATIRESLEKCALALDMRLDDARCVIFCEDIYEIYYGESLEDVQQCLKMARQGKFGLAHFKRDALTMPLIRYWFQCYLDRKSELRERVLAEAKAKQLSEAKDLTPEQKELADKYLDQFREMIDGNQKKTKAGPTPFKGERASDFWLSELKKSRPRRLVYRLIVKKHQAGKILSRRESKFLQDWNIKL